MAAHTTKHVQTLATFNKEANSKIKILLVDDQPELAKVTAMLLQIHGFQVQTCHSGAACIRIAEDTNPDIILLDIGMPVMDGYAVCDYIRRQYWGKHLIIFALTGYDEDSYNQRSWHECFDERLIKPVSHEVLAATVNKHVLKKTA